MSMLLSCDDIFSVVAESDGLVIGSNFLWETGPVAGVGPITIDPSAQDRSVGRRLMEEVLKCGRERRFPGIRLVQAGYHTRSLSLYVKLGFAVREPLVTMQGSTICDTVQGCAVRPASKEDLGACNRLHFEVHGFEREWDLLNAIEQGTANLVERGGRVTSIGFFGQAVGETNDDLKALIGAATEFLGPGFSCRRATGNCSVVPSSRLASHSAHDPDEPWALQSTCGPLPAIHSILKLRLVRGSICGLRSNFNGHADSDDRAWSADNSIWELTRAEVEPPLRVRISKALFLKEGRYDWTR